MTLAAVNRPQHITSDNDNHNLMNNLTTTSPSKTSDGKIRGIGWFQLTDRKVQWSIATGFVLLVMILLSRQETSTNVASTNNTRIANVVEQLTPTKTTNDIKKATDETRSSSTGDNHDSETFTKESKTKKIRNPIKQISILGERNSGTRWTSDHIAECFNHSLNVERYLTRYKHWFQYKNYSKYPHDTLVLAQFRNPYEWLKAMEHVPHHSPAHLRTASVKDREELYNRSSASNDWKIFLTKPWTTERVGLDLEMKGDEICTDDFPYKDIVSCNLEPLPMSYYNWTIRYSEHQPFYEMRNDGSGQPYANIMEMRTDKILNFLGVREYEGIADVWVLQYEYLVATGTENLLKRIEEWTGVKANCGPKGSQQRKPKASRIITPEFAKFVRENLNWTVEGLIGYYPELKREEVKEW